MKALSCIRNETSCSAMICVQRGHGDGELSQRTHRSTHTRRRAAGAAACTTGSRVAAPHPSHPRMYLLPLPLLPALVHELIDAIGADTIHHGRRNLQVPRLGRLQLLPLRHRESSAVLNILFEEDAPRLERGAPCAGVVPTPLRQRTRRHRQRALAVALASEAACQSAALRLERIPIPRARFSVSHIDV